MIVGKDRGQLDTWIDDETTVLLLLRGDENGSQAREVYDYIESTRANNSRQYDDWQHQVLVTENGNISPDEAAAWFANASNCYAVLRNRAATDPKTVVKQGPITDLLFTDGDQEPDYVQIRIAFLTQ